MDACCAVPGNHCHRGHTLGACTNCCTDHTSSSDWLFGLWPGPPQRFEPTRTDGYQQVGADRWPIWGASPYDLNIGKHITGAPGGENGLCDQGSFYRGTHGEICGGYHNWGATDVEVWYPR